MFFFPLPYIILEVLAFTTCLHFYSFWEVFFGYLIPSFFGVLLFSTVGKSLLMSMQSGMQPGHLPNDKILHRGALLLASVLLIVPLFFTRVAAILLIVPGTRHLCIFIFKAFIFKRLSKGAFSFARFGGNGSQGFGGFRTGQAGFGFPPEEPRQERDAEVVNVTPIEITHTKINSTETK